VCLTFDDGPHPEHTPRVLDALARDGVQAAFFVIGRRAERHPDIVRRMASEGHVVGHHSFTHPDPMATPSSVMHIEARRATETLQTILGQPVRFYRPPHGKLRPLDFASVWTLRQTIVLWNVDPKDFAQPASQPIAEWFRDRQLRGGDLVLLHDTAPYTAASLPSIVLQARAAGLHFGGLEAWTGWLSRRVKQS
jgi:peptidoglycan/xylan/chitin deacetylase (PgdA/CDA1 family)